MTAALGGDAAAAQALLAGMTDLRASEDPQDQAVISTGEAFTAAARGQPRDALRHARAALAHAEAIGISHDYLRWAWPLAARAACDLGDAAASTELLALLDGRPCGRLAPMLRAERDLARARLAAADGDPGAAAAFTAAVTGLRELSTPYHLAHGLLDHAGYLIRTGDAQTAAAAIQDAGGIAARLGCQPLLDRAADLMPAQPARPPDPVQATRHLLAHALLDHAAHLAARGDTEATAAAIGEAADIAQRLGCQPLMDRAETTQTASPRTAAS